LAAILVDKLVIKAEANHFMANLETENLQCSEGWLFHFSTRKGINMHSVLGELGVFRASP
jgi:hypothetical protein